MENEIRCEIRLAEDEGKPRIVGTLMPYGQRARDRAEVFEVNSLSWPEDGVILHRQHERAQPIMRVLPIVEGNEVRIDQSLPDTSAGRDAAAEIRSGLFKGLSVEFTSTRESFVAGVRRIAKATLRGAGLVDSGAYEAATVEARAKAARRASDRHTREFML